MTYGQGDLALFSIRAAPGGSSVPGDGATQVAMLWDELLQVLEELGSSFEDVIVGRETCWESGMMEVKGQVFKATFMSCCFLLQLQSLSKSSISVFGFL